MPGCCKIRYIVRLRHMLLCWRRKAAAAARALPSDVPAGHVAVMVGPSPRRFVVRASHLNHPLFKKLLLQAAEEHGFRNFGPLAIPCEETLFEEILRFVTRSESGKCHPGRFLNLDEFQRYCHMDVRSNLEILAESRPLLHGISDKSVW